MTGNLEKTMEIAKKCPKCSFRALAGPYVLKIGPRDYYHCSQHIKRVQKPYQPPLDYENKGFLNPVTVNTYGRDYPKRVKIILPPFISTGIQSNVKSNS